MKTNLLNLTQQELAAFLDEHQEPPYRAKQVFAWLHRGVPIAEMTNLSKTTREKLAAAAYADYPKIERRYVSALDGTIKYLFALSDGQLIESVLMKYKHGNTICVSTQAGCRMGCRFCASTLRGLSRNLEVSEILGQVIVAARDSGERVDGIVMMGIGEPLDNYENSVKFIRIVSAPGGLNIGCRHISLSTCGLANKIRRLASEELPITLSVSLHASDDDTRSSLMPVNNRWPIAELLDACAYYFLQTRRRVSFEYTLINNLNDSDKDAKKLAELLRRSFPQEMPIHVNLIPVNPIVERKIAAASRNNAFRFAEILKQNKINATIRRKLGADIDASCGMLRLGGQ